MGKWEESKLNDIFDVRDGTHDSPKYYEEGYPFVTSKNLKDNSIDLTNVKYISEEDYIEFNKRSKVDIGDILFAMIGTIGNPVLITEEPNFAIKNVGLFKYRTGKVLPEFLIYFLNQPKTIQKMLSEARGATQKFVGLGYLRKFKIKFPSSLDTQRQIVSKLDALFENIDASLELLQENLEEAEALKASVLDEEIVSRVKDSDFTTYKIKDVVKNTSNVNPLIDFNDEEITYVDISSINRETNEIEDPKILLGNEAPSRARVQLEVEDIVFATTRPNLKNIAVIQKEYLTPIGSTGFCVLRPIKELVISRFLFYILLTNHIQTAISPFIRGAQYPAISNKNLKEVEIYLPSVKKQQQIVSKLDTLFSHIDGLISEIKDKVENLEALKGSLLDKAFKGEL